MNLLTTTAVISAALGCALVGGIFFAFSNFIMKALQRVPSPEGMVVDSEPCKTLIPADMDVLPLRFGVRAEVSIQPGALSTMAVDDVS